MYLLTYLLTSSIDRHTNHITAAKHLISGSQEDNLASEA